MRSKIDEEVVHMQEIWMHSPALSAEEQKPMFKAEQEAEKALGYLEGLSLAQLAAVLLTSGERPGSTRSGPIALSLCPLMLLQR